MQTKRPAGRLPDAPNPIADDGDETRFCSTCAFSSACLAAGYSKPELAELHCVVEHVGPFRAGDRVFRTGEPFRAIFAVRAGTVKTRTFDKEGREQVLGFYLPGEMVGLNAIYPERFPCDAVALDTAYFCRFSFPAMSALASRLPAVQQHLFRLLSKELGTASQLAGDHSADERVAAFLVDLAGRYEARGFSGTRLHLSMSRSDIANYLRMAAETVSRVLGRFRSRHLLALEGRELELLDPECLHEIGRSLLPEDSCHRPPATHLPACVAGDPSMLPDQVCTGTDRGSGIGAGGADRADRASMDARKRQTKSSVTSNNPG